MLLFVQKKKATIGVASQFIGISEAANKVRLTKVVLYLLILFPHSFNQD